MALVVLYVLALRSNAMSLYTYQATVRVTTSIGGTLVVTTQVQAENEIAARWLLEAQYGQGNVLHLPQRVS